MESLNIILTNRINNSGIETEDVYNINLIKTDENGVTKNITLPVLPSSEIGMFISSLSNHPGMVFGDLALKFSNNFSMMSASK